MKFIITSVYGESLNIAMYLKFVEGHDVVMHITNADYRKIGDGIIEKENHWWRLIGKDYIWYFDSCDHGDRQDWLREQGEAVFGTSYRATKLEDDRQLGQQLFKKMGLAQSESHNFKDIDKALEFVLANPEKKWILKQNGSAPKHLNHLTKFDGGIDMIYHLNKLKKSWNEAEWGCFDCDLMEQVEGLEIAVSAFFNGTNFMRGADGKIAAFLNFEHKKEATGDLGETTGEMGTVFVHANTDNKLVEMLLENPVLVEALRKTKFRGVFDINGCMTKDRGYVAFEPTMRPGLPSSSYEFLGGAGLVSRTSFLFESVAKGFDVPIKLFKGTGIVMCVVGKPFPLECPVEKEGTSVDEKLWILQGNNPIPEFTTEQRIHINLENFYKDGEDYLVAVKNGGLYLYTVTMRGKNVKEAREKCIQYIKDNTYLYGSKYRTDIGLKLEAKGF